MFFCVLLDIKFTIQFAFILSCPQHLHTRYSLKNPATELFIFILFEIFRQQCSFGKGSVF